MMEKQTLYRDFRKLNTFSHTVLTQSYPNPNPFVLRMAAHSEPFGR